MRYGERRQRGEEEGRVGWLDKLVDVGRGLFEDEGPEVGDLGDGLLALFVEGGGQFDLFADCGEDRVSNCA